ncbi:hypothetical protein V8C37DRAFT_385907 [Trichoderma ceciliae]
MSRWLSSHGAGAIKDSGNQFAITIEGGLSTIRPDNANELHGAIHFVIPGPLHDTQDVTAIAVDFSSHSARVDEVVVFSGSDEIFRRHRLLKTASFTMNIPSTSCQAIEDGKGVALAVYVRFNNASSDISFRYEMKSDTQPSRAAAEINQNRYIQTDIQSLQERIIELERRLETYKMFMPNLESYRVDSRESKPPSIAMQTHMGPGIPLIVGPVAVAGALTRMPLARSLLKGRRMKARLR